MFVAVTVTTAAVMLSAIPNRPATLTRIVVVSGIVQLQLAARVSARRNEPVESYALVPAGVDSIGVARRWLGRR